MIVLAFYDLINDDYVKSSVAFLVGWTGIIQSHVLSTELVLGFSLLFCIINFQSIINKQRIKSLLVSVIAVLTVNASFIIPFLDYSFRNKCNITQSWRGGSIQKHGAFVQQLFYLLPKSNGISSTMAQGMDNDMPLTVGVSLMIGLIIAVIVCFTKGINSNSLRLFCGLSLLSLFMSTIYFPWDAICKIGALRRFVVNIQFSWRFLEIALVFIVMSVGNMIRIMTWKNTNKYIRLLVVALLVSLSVISASFYMVSIPNSQIEKDFNSEQEIDSSRWDEYLLVDAENTNQTGTYDATNVNLTSYKKDISKFNSSIHHKKMVV